ncbi:thioesterase domain-containing protein [Microvirga calopogonii]|uniref:thioesterase domain-containing protein n=1 Tax=Microvirga calopogonii TaxID=2078013 RepID=UPI000E0D176A|nr:thioesterase domain-containing protein [Microvirga calopogonii]
MSVGSILAELREKDIKIWADGDRLRCEALPGALTPELRTLLAEHKAELLASLKAVQERSQEQKSLVPLQKNRDGTPIFAVPGHNGDVFCYRALARHLGNQQPFFGLQPPGLDGEEKPLTKVEEIAAYFARQIRQTTTQPVIIAGFCAGGTIAFELARQLEGIDVPVALLAMFGSPHPAYFRPYNRIKERVVKNLKSASADIDGFRTTAYKAISAVARKLRTSRAPATNTEEDPFLTRRALVEQATMTAVAQYKPLSYSGRTSLFLPSADWADSQQFARLWSAHVSHCEEYVGPEGCDTDNMLLEQNAPAFSAMFTSLIQDVLMKQSAPSYA